MKPLKVTIVQQGIYSVISLNGRDISSHVTNIEISRHVGERTHITLGLIVDEIEISTLGDADHVMMVNLPDEVSDVLCSLGWTPPEDHRNTYRIARRDSPRFELDNASPDAND